MNQLPGWSIGKDNKVRANPYEMRQLKTKRRLTGRTLNVECPNYPDVDQASARMIAEMAKASAVIAGCGYIMVKGPRWKYEFSLADINGQKGEWWGRRGGGMMQNPKEMQMAGSSFDTSRKVWTVPQSFNVREKITFSAGNPAVSAETNNSPALIT